MVKKIKNSMLVSLLLYPAQLPVFAIENIVTFLKNKRWQLPPILSSMYFLVVSLLSSFVVVSLGRDVFGMGA
ncbi:hypothetical protein [Teredinibacter turnerae]|uniref:hypothetical protein n=1 Tax=Teredinibacter turnerae TaxID=2426 RepID=UPI0004280D64|nr:hypothetical protein [Teredinibacter turnerae]